jgi:Stress responsive A/B Barrel Domain
MFIHIFGFRWKPQATDADKARAQRDILAFRGDIPGLLELAVGPNLSPRGQGYTFAGLMKFTDKAAYDAYTTHPAHLALLQWLVPLIDPIELDFEA